MPDPIDTTQKLTDAGLDPFAAVLFTLVLVLLFGGAGGFLWVARSILIPIRDSISHVDETGKIVQRTVTELRKDNSRQAESLHKRLDQQDHAREQQAAGIHKRLDNHDRTLDRIRDDIRRPA